MFVYIMYYYYIHYLQFAPAVFSQTGQIYGPFKSLIKEQIRRHLIDFEGQAKPSKIKSVMK